MKYFYWRCGKCDRRFKSLFDGGRGVECVCSAIFGVSETTKQEYDLWVEKELKLCKAT